MFLFREKKSLPPCYKEFNMMYDEFIVSIEHKKNSDVMSHQIL